MLTEPMVLAAPRLNMLMPSCVVMFRSTLAKRTFSNIWRGGGGTVTYIRLTTLPAPDAIWTARSELARSFTVPRRKTRLFSATTEISCPGSAARSRGEGRSWRHLLWRGWRER